MSTAFLERVLLPRLPEGPGREWFATAATAEREPTLATAFTLAGRKLGSEPLLLDEAETREAETAGLPWLAGARSSAAEVARVLLLAAAVKRSPDPFAAVAEWYRQGDNAEKQAVLRGIVVLPEPARFVEVAVNACRTSVQSVFDAIACENRFPAEHFTDLAFNQMVLKALFTGVALERIVDLERRKNEELARMAAGYASERHAAGRSVPADIDRVL